MSKCLRGVMLISTLAISGLSLSAQSGSPQQPSDSSKASEVFAPLLASPTEPASLLRYPGDSEMDFELAEPFALYTVEGKNSSWQVGLWPGIAARFQKSTTQLLLEAVDFRLAVPVAYQKGRWSTRVELFHQSSHRGADFNPGVPPGFSYSREAVQVLVAYGNPDHWRAYAGPTVLLRTHPSVGRWAFQAGTEWFPKMLAGRQARFYLAEDVVTPEEVRWHANVSVQPGVLITTGDGKPVARLAGWFYHGEAPFGQLFRMRETRVGAEIVMELRPLPRSLVTRHK